MRIALILPLLITSLILISCASFTRPDVQVIPPPGRAGCTQYAHNRTQYQSCLVGMRATWEKRENADPVLELLDTRRSDAVWVIQHYRICRLDFCNEFEIPSEDHTLWGDIQSGGIWFLTGFVTGVIAVFAGG